MKAPRGWQYDGMVTFNSAGECKSKVFIARWWELRRWFFWWFRATGKSTLTLVDGIVVRCHDV